MNSGASAPLSLGALMQQTITDTGAIERLSYYEPEDMLVVEKIYDPTAVIEANAAQRALNGKAKLSENRLVKVAEIDMDHVTALENMGYRLFSSDQTEVRRTLCYIQENEPVWMTVEGKPFAKWRPKWR